ncbi:MAG: hypothetical protein AAGU05_03085 [Anaerolineaceae bacterium]
MAYKHTNSKGQSYFLHAKERKLKDGRTSYLYFFSKEEKGALDAVPKGYKVSETGTGMLVLKKA